jgi:hypothetical protein
VIQNKTEKSFKIFQEKTKTASNQPNKAVRKKATILSCALGIIMIAGAIGIFPKLSVTHAAHVESIGVGIYWDPKCTNRTLELNLGNIAPNSNTTRTVYIRNEDDTKVTLSLSTSEWSPQKASEYMRLSWTYDGRTLSTGQIIPVTLTLSVDSEISGVTDFQFNTIITAINMG